MTEPGTIEGWLPVPLAAVYVGRKERTIRTWVNRGDLPREVRKGVVFVDLRTAIRLAATRPRLTYRPKGRSAVLE